MIQKLADDMLLYHGSYCVVKKPDLKKCARYKDFGQGFYLTTSKKQAEDFAGISTRKAIANGVVGLECRSGRVSVFQFKYVNKLAIKIYPSADADWLHCVVGHRKAGSESADNICISLLLPERLQNQFCFRTNEALACLTFVESGQVWI